MLLKAVKISAAQKSYPPPMGRAQEPSARPVVFLIADFFYRAEVLENGADGADRARGKKEPRGTTHCTYYTMYEYTIQLGFPCLYYLSLPTLCALTERGIPSHVRCLTIY